MTMVTMAMMIKVTDDDGQGSQPLSKAENPRICTMGWVQRTCRPHKRGAMMGDEEGPREEETEGKELVRKPLHHSQ